MSIEAGIALPSKCWVQLDVVDEAPDLENESGRAEVERTDHDEVAVHFTLTADDQATVSLYVDRAHALALAERLRMEATR